MKVLGHIAAAVPLSIAVQLTTGSGQASAAAAAASVLVDVDHLPDYLYWRGGWRSLEDFFAAFHQKKTTWLVICLHAWEWTALSGALIFTLGGPLWLKAAWAGWLYHLIWDQFTNQVSPWFYFFCFRASKGFLRGVLKPNPPKEA